MAEPKAAIRTCSQQQQMQWLNPELFRPSKSPSFVRQVWSDPQQLFFPAERGAPSGSSSVPPVILQPSSRRAAMLRGSSVAPRTTVQAASRCSELRPLLPPLQYNSNQSPLSLRTGTPYAGHATALPSGYISAPVSATIACSTSTSTAGVAYRSVATSTSATLPRNGIPSSKATWLLTADPSTACSKPLRSPFCAPAAAGASRCSVWSPAASPLPGPAPVTAAVASAKSSGSTRSSWLVPRMRRLTLNYSGAAPVTCPSRTSLPPVFTLDANPTSALASLPLPARSHNLLRTRVPPSSCSGLIPCVSSGAVIPASSPAARANASPNKKTYAPLHSDVGTNASPQTEASTPSATASAASLPSQDFSGPPLCVGAARETASVLSYHPELATSTQCSSPSPPLLPHLCRGTPLRPFIRSMPSIALLRTHSLGPKEKDNSAGVHPRGKRLLSTATSTSLCRGLCPRGHVSQRRKSEKSHKEKMALVDSTASQRQPAKTDLRKTITLLPHQKQVVEEGKLSRPQPQKAHQQAQTTLHHPHDPQKQRQQHLYSCPTYSKAQTTKMLTRTPRQPQEWVPQNFTATAYPHARQRQRLTFGPWKQYNPCYRWQSPSQVTHQQAKSQQRQQRRAEQVQKHFTHEERQQQHTAQHQVKGVQLQQGHSYAPQQPELLQWSPVLAVPVVRQADSAKQQKRVEVHDGPAPTSCANALLRTAKNSTQKQLMCYVCFAAVTAPAAEKEMHVNLFPAADEISASIVSPPCTDEHTDEMTLCSALAAPEQTQPSSLGAPNRDGVSSCSARPGNSFPEHDLEKEVTNITYYLPQNATSSSGVTNFGDSLTAGDYKSNSAVQIGSKTRCVRECNTAPRRFYEVGGLLLCQQCAMLPSVHTERQVHVVLEEALHFLAVEAGVDFNHPDLLELHRFALGSSNDCKRSTSDSSTGTVGVSRSGSESYSTHSTDCYSPPRREAYNGAQRRSSGGEYSCSTGSFSVVHSSSSRNRGVSCYRASARDDTNRSGQRERRNRIEAPTQSDCPSGEELVESQSGSAGDGASKEDNNKGNAAPLKSESAAWEFPFYVEAVSLSALLQPSSLEASQNSVFPATAGGHLRSNLKTADGPSPVAMAAHGDAAAGSPAVKGYTPVSQTYPCMCTTSTGRAAEERRAATPYAPSPATADISSVKIKRSYLPPSSASEKKAHCIKCSTTAESTYLQLSNTPSVCLQQIPERIAFGRCETLKVYPSHASTGIAAARAAAAAAPSQSFWGSEARVILPEDEIINAKASVEHSKDAAERGRSRREHAGPWEPPVTAAAVRRVAGDITSPTDESRVTATGRCDASTQEIQEEFSKSCTIDAAAVAQEVSGRNFLSAQGRNPRAGARVDSIKVLEMPSARAHRTTPAVGTLAAPRADGEMTRKGASITCRRSGSDAVWEYASSEGSRRSGQMKSEVSKCKMVYTTRPEENITTKTAYVTEDSGRVLHRPTKKPSTAIQDPEQPTNAKEDFLARTAEFQSQVTTNTSSAASALREFVSKNQISLELNAATIAMPVGHGVNDSTTSAEYLPSRAAEPTPLAWACPPFSEVAFHSDRDLLLEKTYKLCRPPGDGGCPSWCTGEEIAAASGTEAPSLRGKAAASAQFIEAHFQPAVYRVSVAKGLPDAVFLAHLGHELLHAYLWCTTDVAAAFASAPTEARKKDAKRLSSSRILDTTPGVPKGTIEISDISPTVSSCRALHKTWRAVHNLDQKTAHHGKSHMDHRSEARVIRTSSAPPDDCAGIYTRAAADLLGNSDDSHSCLKAHSGRVVASKSTERITFPVLGATPPAACAELARTSCLYFTDSAEERGIEKREGACRPGTKTPPHQVKRSTVPSAPALVKYEESTDLLCKMPETQQQQLEDESATVLAAPLQRFPPLELALEEGLCNCVAAALLERRAAALHTRLQKLIAAAATLEQARNSTVAKAESLCNNVCMLRPAAVGKRISAIFKDKKGEKPQAVEQSECENQYPVCALQRRDMSPQDTVQPSQGQRVATAKDEQANTQKLSETGLHGVAGQLLLAQEQRLPLRERLLRTALQPAHHKIPAVQAEHQPLHHMSKPELKQQSPQCAQRPKQRTGNGARKQPEDCTQQPLQRCGLQPQSLLDQQKRCKLGGDGICDRGQQMQQQQQVESQKRPAEGLMANEGEISAGHVNEQILQQQMDISAHELSVIQQRLRVMETDSHEIYGKSYNMLRSLMKRVGLQNLLEMARRRQLQ